jgi:Protein of unknown function (DUF4242)
MNTYAIRRTNAWGSAEELQAVANRSKEVADNDFPNEVRWIRSYVIAEDSGSLGSICIYQAVDREAIRQHSQRVGMPADEILEIADTVVIRPDPAPEVVPS